MNEAPVLSFRPAATDDAAHVASLVQRTFTSNHVPGWSIESLRSIHDANSVEALVGSFSEASYQSVAVLDKQIIGYISFAKPHLLSIVAVDAAHHGQGIGSSLLRDAIDVVEKANPALEVLQVNATERSQPFYAKHGFYPISPMINVLDRRFMRMAMWLRPRRMGWA
ncbi:MAG: GNAT family N-acetyltransferase [Betaproteobacteria bacterium]|nr:MAG: GNAT family N-acetyltransferase [Betaproteobacteria bacterium]TAG48574.1 MAG: GNAT family N-acetyltransferase [Betaproteobacteria bacterium]